SHPGARDLDELRLLAELGKRPRPDEAHARAQTADQLNEDIAGVTLELDHALDSLRDHVGEVRFPFPTRLFPPLALHGRAGGCHATGRLVAATVAHHHDTGAL